MALQTPYAPEPAQYAENSNGYRRRRRRRFRRRRRSRYPSFNSRDVLGKME